MVTTLPPQAKKELDEAIQVLQQVIDTKSWLTDKEMLAGAADLVAIAAAKLRLAARSAPTLLEQMEANPP
jgi:hypothetical protein